MVRQMVRRMLKSVIFIVAAALLLCFVISVPVFAGSLAISPNTTELEVLPGTTSSMVLSIENGLERSYNFRFSPAQLFDHPDGYNSFPDLSWIRLALGDTLLAPGEQTWLTVEITIPNDESLVGQKWAISIDISCAGEPLLNNSSTILVIVGHASPPHPEWVIGGGIMAVCVIGAVFWTRRKDRRRAEWTTGLKTKHWL
ncbi:MAG: hypothetical protein JSV77_08025 [Dehalococcoidales bacterium]|nr:MAG: hypothetical protein JSV77_08025 [Dehalococcoidales bacterium]